MRIVSNGSKWAGERPDGLNELLTRLRATPLDPSFENYGNFIGQWNERDARCYEPGETVHLFGNFYAVSGVFSIYGNEEELGEVMAAIRQNQNSPAYQQARQEITDRIERERTERELREAQRRAERINAARRTLAEAA